jgi:adenine-specific DNA-methyltransferase
MVENPAYLTQQLLTYLGNKRALLDFIGSAAQTVRRRLGGEKLSTFDVFSGSGVVSRYLRRHSRHLIANDLEPYAAVISRCYLANPNPALLAELAHHHARVLARLAGEGLRPGFIAQLYAPANDHDIQPGERVFYTSRNARYLDSARQLLEEVPGELRHFLLAPLLAEASVHANTSGVFKGFYKNAQSGLGQFGGNHRDALRRILGDIELPFPVFSNFAVDCEIHQREANQLVEELDEVDLAYLDPPYNQHPYGSNYFMLNLLVDYAPPAATSLVSGIPTDWNRSDFNKRPRALAALAKLVQGVKAKFLLISFNSEGFISRQEMLDLLEPLGRTEVLETPYNTFRGSRNLQARDPHVAEYLFLVERR